MCGKLDAGCVFLVGACLGRPTLMRHDLRLLTESLRDGKVTERKKAVEELSAWFRIPKNVAKIGSNNIEWIEIFEALASSAKATHDATAKKGASAATVQTKLENISAAFRVAVESSIPHLNNASIEYLVPRLAVIMKFNNALVDATGSNYARTLLSVVAHPPHVRSLNDKIWHSVSRLAWAVLLNDRLSDKNSWIEDDPKLNVRTAGSASPTKGARASPVQLIFATILRHLCASPFAPLVERERRPNLVELPDEHNWARYVLVKFCRYFEMYQGSVTSHVDMIPALCHVLEQIELNRVSDMMWFSRRIWPLLVALMKGRVRTDYVQLLVIFQIILPYSVRVENDDVRAEVVTDLVDSNSFRGLTDLVLVIDEHAPLKAGLEPLSMESLRLEFTPPDEDVLTGFRTRTFRHGRAFTGTQAHAWAMLELQADCIFYLYRQEETTPQSQFNYETRPTKRRRSENALEILVDGLKNHNSPMQGLFRLQVLLFLTEKRWDYLDITHQQLIMNALFRLSAVDEASDAFALMCFVAVAAASNKTQGSPVTAGPFWSNMWTHAYRRLSSLSSQVSRAAAHVLHALLKWNRVDSNTVSQHIAQFIRDFREDDENASHDHSLGFQGFQAGSSVNRQTITIHAMTEASCALFVQFITFADADAVLCRLHLEDSVRKWLRKCLNRAISTERFARGSITTGKGNKDSEKLRRAAQRSDAHVNAQDLLQLLQSICGLAVRPTFKCDIRLPDDDLVRAIVAYQADRTLREFVLQTAIPSFICVNDTVVPKRSDNNTASSQVGTTYDGEFSSFSAILVADIAPSARESKTLTMLEDLSRKIVSVDADLGMEPGSQDGKPVAMSSSGILDQSIVTIKVSATILGLQGSLEANSTRPSRELYRLAFGAFQSAAPWQPRDSKTYDWAATQWAEIMCELRPLTWTADLLVDPCRRQIDQFLLRPGIGSGIKRELARRLVMDPVDSRRKTDNDRSRHLINTVWSQKSASDCLTVLNESIRGLLQLFSDRVSLGKEFDSDRANNNPFGTLQHHGGIADADKLSTPSGTAETYFASISVAYITTSSTMSKDPGNPQHDPDLEQVILESEGRAFLTLGQAYCSAVRAGTLHAGPATTRDILTTIMQKLKTWELWRSETMHTLIFQLLDILSPIWLQEAGELKVLVQKLFPRWALRKVVDGGSWRSRAALAAFLGKNLLQESFHQWWRSLKKGDSMDVDDEESVLDMLGDLMSDGDIRVRGMASILYPATFAHPEALGQDIMTLYTKNMTKGLPSDALWFEGMLSRFVALSNTIIVSSPLRRGVYWHILEVTLVEPHYTQYLVSLLSGAAARLGFPGLQALFCAYSAQIAIQVARGQADFLRFPPKVLGFRTHKACADYTLPTVLSTAIITAYTQAKEMGMARPSVLNDAFFDRYCKATRRVPVEALRDCFTQIIAGSIIFDNEGVAPSKSKSSSFYDWILLCARDCDSDRDPREYVKERADSIAAAIFSYGADIDYHPEGGIVNSLRHSGREHGDAWVKTFRKLNQYRRFDDFPMHAVHFPAATTDVIIKSLTWFTDTFVGQSADQEGMSSIYHIIHHLFAAVHSTPLVNEQLRHIHSLCIFLSISEEILDQAPMIQTILTHSIALLSQEDLAHSAQSIITWSLECARNADSSCQNIGLGALISRIGELSVRFSNSKDQRTSNLGFQLLEWVETELQRLCEVDAFQEELQVVVTLWPRVLRIRGNGFSNDDSTERTARVLSRGDASPTGRFRVVRQLNEIPMYATGIFATEHFWTLKESIPADDLLMREDLGAFTELLYKGSGKFHSIRTDAPEEDGLARRHRQNPEESVKHVIVTWLLGQTAVATADTLDTVHNALRRLCHPTCGVPLSDNDTVLSLFRAGAQEPLQIVDCDTSFLKKQASRDLASNYEKWLRDVTIFFSQILSKVDIFYAQLHSLLTDGDTFATNLLPILVHQVLSSDYDGLLEAPLRAILSNYLLTLIRSSTTDVVVLQVIIDLILHLRCFERPGDDPVGHDKWLDISFMDVCKTSLKCGAYTTSLLFLELAQEYRDRDDNISLDEWELDTETVLYEIYRHIEEPDGFYAIKGKDIRKHLMQKFHHENKWDKAFQSHVSQFEVAQSGMQSDASQHNLSGVVESLHAYGFSHLAMSLARSTSEGTSADFIYSLAWRTDAWDLPQVLSYNSRNASLYGVMRAVHRGKDMESTKLLCEIAARREMQTLRITNPENVVEIRNSIQSLLCLREVQHWVQDWRQLQSQPISSSAKRFKQYFSLSPELDFSAAEWIVATRMSLVRCLIQSISSNQIGNMEASSISGLTELETRCLVDLAANARMSNMPQVAFNAISRAQQINPLGSFHVSTEFAEALWTQQEHAMAIQFLTQLIQQKFPSEAHVSSSKVNKNLGLEEAQEWAQLYARLGSWTTAARFASPQDIRTQWFDPGVKLLDPLNQIQRRPAKMVYYQYASFANKQLRQMESSEEYKRQKEWSDKVKAEIKELGRGIAGTRSQSEKEDLRRRREKSQRFLEADEKNLKEHEAAVKSFLQQAISMYAHYMEASNTLDQEIAVRFCGLWFAHFDSEIAAESIKHALPKISSHKLLFLSHQLTARLGSSNDGEKRSQQFLKQVVEAMCSNHPFHSLFQVLTMRGLAPSPKDARVENNSGDSSIKRRDEAKRIIETVRLKIKDGALARPDRFMELMEESFKAYVEWAQYPIKELNPKNGVYYSIPKNIAIFKWTWDGRSKLNKPQRLCIPVVTAEIPIEMDGRYLDIPTIQWYERRYTVAGGVHVPKISLCIDTLGRQHRQLFKGEGGDDLRQDAVMEQVFDLVNIMLAQDRETKRRDLSLRTYKVIPLPSQTGLLQFIDNTETLSAWLPQAHAKYRPGDMPLRDTQILLKQQARSTNLEERVQVFLRISREFRPVLRHFFTESNKQSVVWYAKRLTYSRSVATCGIAGHILGLGDRHLSNLLMDARTGEMIHIDLGIAFDQGKYLPIPELVPFRLTADVVDGMGISGTEGVFRKCSEQTLRVLREGSDVIKTILEVFKYDPLYIWTPTPDKLRRVQDGDVESAEVVKPALGSEQVLQGAERAINSVSRKLDAALSVEYTVNDLINAARDPANLTRIFHGWSPQC